MDGVPIRLIMPPPKPHARWLDTDLVGHPSGAAHRPESYPRRVDAHFVAVEDGRRPPCGRPVASLDTPSGEVPRFRREANCEYPRGTQIQQDSGSAGGRTGKCQGSPLA
jgi:hypothetical protein